MAHTLSYFIDSNDNISIDYVETGFVPYFQPVWEQDVNQFNSITDVSADDPNTPDLIRILNNGDYLYYYKTIHVPWATTSFHIVPIIDNMEGSYSFVYENYTSFLQTKKVGSEIYVTVEKNKQKEDREATLNISYSTNPSLKRTIRIIQNRCNLSLELLSCIIKDGDNENETPINNNTYEYTFDTLTDRTDFNEQSLTFNIGITGLTKKYYVKEMKKYGDEGEIDSTYVFINGKYYKIKQKIVDGQIVNYYADTIVIANHGYQEKKYDGPFHIEFLADNKLKIINYGRVYMEDNAFYIITIACRDNINTTCEIILKYNNNPINRLGAA